VIYLFIYLFILILFRILNTKLQTLHFLRTCRTKLNTALESKAAFVQLNCIVHSTALRGRTRNSRERKLLPYSLVLNNYYQIHTVIFFFSRRTDKNLERESRIREEVFTFSHFTFHIFAKIFRLTTVKRTV
jgi:hypothetical protein